jgi:hypothetical protein
VVYGSRIHARQHLRTDTNLENRRVLNRIQGKRGDDEFRVAGHRIDLDSCGFNDTT